MACHHKSKLESEINQDFDLFFLHEKCEVNEVTQYIFLHQKLAQHKTFSFLLLLKSCQNELGWFFQITNNVLFICCCSEICHFLLSLFSEPHKDGPSYRVYCGNLDPEMKYTFVSLFLLMPLLPFATLSSVDLCPCSTVCYLSTCPHLSPLLASLHHLCWWDFLPYSWISRPISFRK